VEKRNTFEETLKNCGWKRSRGDNFTTATFWKRYGFAAAAADNDDYNYYWNDG